MKQQDWTEQLRERLDDYESPVPQDLWAQVERGLNRRARLVALRRWAVAAAACALLLAGLWQLRPAATPSPQQMAAGPVQPLAPQTPQAAPDTTATARTGPAPAAAQPHCPTPPLTAMTAAQPTAANEQSPAAEAQRSTSEPQGSSPAENSLSTASQSSSPAKNSLAPASQGSSPRTADSPPKRRKRSEGPTLALRATNLLSGGDATLSQPLLMTRQYMGYVSNAMARKAPVYLTNYEEQTRHAVPLTVGLSVAMPLSDRWWLSTGIDITRAKSTFTLHMGNRTQVSEQRLDYVGVPLQAGYTFWQAPSLKAYAAAGGEAQFNTRVRLSSGRLGHDRVQWSAGVSAGVELSVVPQLSVYAEPCLRYYADNGSPVQTIYKEKPLQLNLQLGLRWRWK